MESYNNGWLKARGGRQTFVLFYLYVIFPLFDVNGYGGWFLTLFQVVGLVLAVKGGSKPSWILCRIFDLVKSKFRLITYINPCGWDEDDLGCWSGWVSKSQSFIQRGIILEKDQMLGLMKIPRTTKILWWNEGHRSTESKLTRIWIIDSNHIFVEDRTLVNISDGLRWPATINVKWNNDNCWSV